MTLGVLIADPLALKVREVDTPLHVRAFDPLALRVRAWDPLALDIRANADVTVQPGTGIPFAPLFDRLLGALLFDSSTGAALTVR